MLRAVGFADISATGTFAGPQAGIVQALPLRRRIATLSKSLEKPRNDRARAPLRS